MAWVIIAALGREHQALHKELQSLRRSVADLSAQRASGTAPAAAPSTSEWPLAPTGRATPDASPPPDQVPAATYHDVAERLAGLVPGVPELTTGAETRSDRALVEDLLTRVGRAGLALPPDLAAHLMALDPSLMVVIARARVGG